MLKHFIFLGSFFIATISYAQQGDGGQPKGAKTSIDIKTVEELVFAQPNIEQLRTEDAVNDHTGSGPWRFGFNNMTNLNTTNSGTWFDLPNGDLIWLVKLTCTNALTVNLSLNDVKLPEGNELYVYNPDKDFILGKFTANHLYEGELGTELVPGQTAIVEYYIPAANRDLANGLTIYRVTHGYRTAAEYHEKAFGSSGSCNMNVNCADGAPWVDQRNSAVMLVSGGSGFCSGALINNTQNDGKPYVLTANHCYSSPTSWVFRFNWQATACTNPSASPTFQSLSGAVLRSRRSPSDFCLVEITGGLVNNTVPLTYSPYFAGWDNSGTNPTSTVSIHHPSGDIKKISFDDAAAAPVTAMGSEAQGCWGVEWDRNTTTEGGSSGSPLFDQSKRIIGQLWGGGASCSNLSAPDYYGRLSKSWNPSGSNSTNQLMFWLDPTSSNATFINGYDPNGSTSVALDAGLSTPQGVAGTLCTATVTPQVTITNSGTSTLTALTINYGFDGPTNLTFNWTGSLAQYQTTVVTLPTATLAGGNHTFNAIISNPNGAADENASNNTIASSFTTVVGGLIAGLTLNLDCYASETAWQLTTSTGSVLFSGSGYVDDNPITVNENFCLNYGCYNFTITDTYGDGLTGCSAANGGAGSYQITFNGAIKAELTEAQANFGPTNTQNFCIIDDTGLEDLAISNSVSVYPNPANESLTVTANGLNLTVVDVLSLTGQLLQNIPSEGTAVKVNVADLAAGVYFIRVTTEQGIALKQIIVE